MFLKVLLTASTLGLEVDRTRSPLEPPSFAQATPSGLEKCLINASVSNKVNPEKVFDLSWEGAAMAASCRILEPNLQSFFERKHAAHVRETTPLSRSPTAVSLVAPCVCNRQAFFLTVPSKWCRVPFLVSKNLSSAHIVYMYNTMSPSFDENRFRAAYIMTSRVGGREKGGAKAISSTH